MRRAIGLSALATALAVIAPVRATAPVDQYVPFASDNDTIRDLRTGLTWQRAFSDVATDRDGAVAHCVGLGLAQLKWRLPTYKELLTIVDEHYYYYFDSNGVTRSQAIYINAFPLTPDEDFWSSSDATAAGYGWVVDFSSGESATKQTNRASRFRCVHDEQ